MGDWQFPETPPGPVYRGRRRRVINVGGRSPWPRYLAWVVVIGATALVGRLGWQAWRYLTHSRQAIAVPEAATTPTNASAPWERDLLLAIHDAVQDVEARRATEAEIDVDRAASIATAMRLQSRRAQAAFFATAIAALDQVLATKSDDPDMIDHVTEARVALAELRSAQNGASGSQGESGEVPIGLDVLSGTSAPGGPNATNGPKAAGAGRGPKHVSIDAPRELGADSILDPATLGGEYLDATFMPDTSEILLPPETRAFADNVRVENLTIAGASQTLDGIHWRDVMFIGTHLRYESGGLDLDNVSFVNCRFGFPSDENGARLANVIALGQTSVRIDEPAQAPATDTSE